MIMDKLAEFCDATAMNTGGADNYVLGSTYDLGIARDVGHGQPLYLVLTVDTAFTSGGSATTEIQLRSDSVTPIDPDNATLHFSTGPIAVAEFTEGRQFVYTLPIEGLPYERYLGLVQVQAVAALTAGAINAFLTMDPPGWKAYPEGQN